MYKKISRLESKKREREDDGLPRSSAVRETETEAAERVGT